MAGTTPHSLLVPGKVIDRRFVVNKLQKKGGFGQIYKGYDQNQMKNVAIKVEDKRLSSTLLNEVIIYEHLNMVEASYNGFPKMHYYTSDDRLRIVIVDWMGRNMEEQFEKNKSQFSPRAVATFMYQALQRLEFLHKTNYIHGDIKPENFMICKRNNCDYITLIDFGLSTKFWNEATNRHVTYQDTEFSGTRLFAPINSHKHKVQSRRDDLQALGYVMAYFLNEGWLPWLEPKKDKYDKNGNKIDETLVLKQSTRLSDLCKGFPRQFLQYLEDVHALRFTEKPNYVKLKTYFEEVLEGRVITPLPLRSSARLKNGNLKRIRVESETSNSEKLVNKGKRRRQ